MYKQYKMVVYKLSSIPKLIDEIKTNKTSVSKYYDIIEYLSKNQQNYILIKYNKDLLRPDLTRSYGLLKSIVVYKSRLLAFSPPKSLLAEYFMIKYPNKSNNIIAEEFIEGTMINLFYDNVLKCWEISTRNTVGGDVTFHSNKTFKTLFLEVCTSNGLNISLMDPRYSYSFVLQHKENRLVVPINRDNLYLINVYDIIYTTDDIVVHELNMEEVKLWPFWKNNNIKFVSKYEFNTYSELIEKYASRNTPYDIMGVVIRNTETGERTKIRNPIYEEVKQLRGNQPKLLYQYLCLRKQGKVHEFLTYYPEMKDKLSQFRDRVHMFSDNLHKNYVECYVKKANPLNTYSSQYKTHMYNLHQHFISNLLPIKQFINKTEVIKYVNELHPSLLMHSLNYNLRKKIIDELKNEVDLP